MTIHKEGYVTISFMLILLTAITLTIWYLTPNYPIISIIAGSILFGLWLFIISFFRSPNRKINKKSKAILAPADGKVVAIEEVEENEYFNTRRIQVSIFMSPLNVHINWHPIAGEVKFSKYHHGLHLVAWHPKSSTDNERSTVVVCREDGKEILFRQIAGAVARRVVSYAKVGQKVGQGDEFGFIKFGSRVDIFLPLGTEVKVAIDQMVSGRQTVIANL